MRYFGHLMRAHQSLEKYIMLELLQEQDKRDIKSVTGLSVNDLKQLVKDRKKFISPEDSTDLIIKYSIRNQLKETFFPETETRT